MTSYILNVCKKILASSSNKEVRRLLDDFLCRDLGWDNYIYVAHVPTRFVWSRAQGMVITNYPVRWLFNYMCKGYYSFDPLVTHCQNHNIGMVWVSDPKAWVDFRAEVQEIAASARKEGWTGGLAIPIPAVPCRGTFALLTRKPMESIQDMLDFGLMVGPAIGLHIHDALLEIALNSRLSPLERKNFVIGNLEKDILQWTAEGLSGKQVAHRLGISAKAVERQLEKVRQRLNAPNRAKMLVMAFGLGLIETGRAWNHGGIINAEGYEERLEDLVSGKVKVSPEFAHDFLLGEYPPDQVIDRSNR